MTSPKTTAERGISPCLFIPFSQCIFLCSSTSTGVTTQWAKLENSSWMKPNPDCFEPKPVHYVSSWMLCWLEGRHGRDQAAKGRGGVLWLFQQHCSLKWAWNSSMSWSPLCRVTTQYTTVKKHGIIERLPWICSWHHILRFVLWSTRAPASISCIYLACIDPCSATVISCL